MPSSSGAETSSIRRRSPLTGQRRHRVIAATASLGVELCRTGGRLGCRSVGSAVWSDSAGSTRRSCTWRRQPTTCTWRGQRCWTPARCPAPRTPNGSPTWSALVCTAFRRCANGWPTVASAYTQPDWIDVDVDPADHIERHDDGDLEKVAARVLSMPIDRNRPLWEMHVVPDLPQGPDGLDHQTPPCGARRAVGRRADGPVAGPGADAGRHEEPGSIRRPGAGTDPRRPQGGRPQAGRSRRGAGGRRRAPGGRRRRSDDPLGPASIPRQARPAA